MDNQTVLVVVGANGISEDGKHKQGDGVVFVYSQAIQVRERFYKSRVQDLSVTIADIFGIERP